MVAFRSTSFILLSTIEVPLTEAVEISPALLTVNFCTPAADAVRISWSPVWFNLTNANPVTAPVEVKPPLKLLKVVVVAPRPVTAARVSASVPVIVIVPAE